ncbi:MAG: ribosome assembly RNA-binding protein YhbY [Halothiobacillaceae bacterium]
MALTRNQQKFLKAEAHHLKPVVLLGQHGLTEAVLAEIDEALRVHELIKVRIPGQSREDKQAMVNRIARDCAAEAVQTVGHVATFFRANPDRPRLELPR